MGLFLLGLLVPPALFFAASYAVDWYNDQPSLADSVQWESLVSSDVIVTKDEAFIAVWEINGPDLSFTSAARGNALADRVKRLLDTLDGKTMLHVDTVRVRSDDYDTASGGCPPVAQFLDQQRRKDYQSGEHFENRTFMALTITTGDDTTSSFSSWVYTGDHSTRATATDKLKRAEERIREFQQYIPEDLRPRRLSGKDLTSYLYLMMTGRNVDITPPPKLYSSLRYLFAHDLRSGFEPKLGDRWYAAVGIWGYPDDVFLGAAEAMYNVDFPYRFSNRLIGLDKSEALKLIQKRTGKFQMQANDWLSLLSDDPDQSDPNDLYKDDYAQEMAFETKEAERKVQSGDGLVHHTGTIIVWDEDKERCKDKAVEVQKHLRNVGRGFIVGKERGMATEALIGSWAGHGAPNQRRYFLMTPAAARQLPVTGTYPGPHETPCSFYEDEEGDSPPPLFFARTNESVPYRYSPFGESGDVGHQAVVGPTGSGKSIFLAFQALRQLHFEGGRSIVFDRGGSFAPICEALGGKRYNLSKIEEGFQPLSDIQVESERRWATKWISDICESQGLQVSPTRRKMISDTLRDMTDRGERTLQNFYQLIGGQDQELASAMEPFAGYGDLGPLLNGDEDYFTDDNFLVVELGSLTDLDPKIYTPVLTYLFHKIETMLSPTQPTHVIADEFFVLAQESKIGREAIEDALRTYRKKNAFVTIGTQSPGDLTGNETEGILNSIKSFIMLPNPSAQSPVQKKEYNNIGIGDEELRLITHAQKKKEYIVIQPDGSRKLDLGLGPELAFMDTYRDLDEEETAELMQEFKQRYGSRWIYEWLKVRGMEEIASDAPLDTSQHASGGHIKFLPPGPDENLEDLNAPTRLLEGFGGTRSRAVSGPESENGRSPEGKPSEDVERELALKDMMDSVK